MDPHVGAHRPDIRQKGGESQEGLGREIQKWLDWPRAGKRAGGAAKRLDHVPGGYGLRVQHRPDTYLMFLSY